jgi:aldose 1-epimerase
MTMTKRIHPFIVCMAASASILIACSTCNAIPAATEGVTSAPFGTCDQGPVTIYTLINKNALQVRAMDFGATIAGVVTPDKNGKFDDIVLGFDNPQTYAKAKLTFGSAGRVINRIAGGNFTLDGVSYNLDKNLPPNTIHGGKLGFARQLWKGNILSMTPPSVRFTRESPDGEQGFPGRLKASATFTLTDENRLIVHYEAVTDKPTVVNLASHTLFNLSGPGNGTILHDIAQINADAYTPADATGIPTGEIRPVDGTPLDFRKPMEIGARIKELTNTPQGYDFNYTLNTGTQGEYTAEIHDPVSGRELRVKTDQPGMQFYTGNLFDGTLIGKGGVPYTQYCAFSCETQHYPDSPNHPNFPSVVLRPGETYSTTTEYSFSTR